jgi:predicted DNA-binding transcriptional regulator AlpA
MSKVNRPNPLPPLPRRLMRKAQVCDYVGVGRTQIMVFVKRGQFPKPVRLSPTGRAIAWFADDVEAWMREREAERGPALQVEPAKVLEDA